METNGALTNYVHNGSHAYPVSWPRIILILPQNPSLDKQEWVLLYAHQECNRSRGACIPHRNTERSTCRTEVLVVQPFFYHYKHDHKLISTSFPILMQVEWLLQICYDYRLWGSRITVYITESQVSSPRNVIIINQAGNHTGDKWQVITCRC